MDRELRREIAAEVREVTERVQREHWETYNEKWVRGKELGKVIACFGAGWLKAYGSSLPRTQAIVLDKNNVEVETGWVYPLHRIQRMMINGEIKGLKVVCDGIAGKGTGQE
jgi:hypothetical protein